MNTTTYRRGRSPCTKPAITLQVESETLEETHDITHAITAALEYFQLVVQSFDKAAGLMVDEVVRNQIAPAVQQFQEWLKAAQAALCDPPLPETLRRNPSAFERAVSKILVSSSRKL